MGNEQRITVSKVMTELNSHLQTYNEKVAPKLHDVHIAVFGERGKGGLCSEVEKHADRINELEKTNKKLDNLTWAVITAVIIQLVMAGIRLI